MLLKGTIQIKHIFPFSPPPSEKFNTHIHSLSNLTAVVGTVLPHSPHNSRIVLNLNNFIMQWATIFFSFVKIP
jgi:hypothetical protein